MGDKLRIGVVGAGWPSWQHIKGYQQLEEAEVVALCDPNTQRLEAIADRYDIPQRYESYDAMLAADEFDAVSICTPNSLHAEMSIKAMRAGAHVHCEKPMAVSSAEAEEMVKVSRETGKHLMVGFQRRFGVEARYLKTYLESGAMGPIYRAKATWIRRRGIPGMGGWFTTKSKSGGGALADIGVHVLDLALWFMGFPQETSVTGSVGARFGNRSLGTSQSAEWAPTAQTTFDVDDYAFAHVRFADGASLSLETSWAGHIKSDMLALELWGENAGASLWPLQIYTDQAGEPVDISPVLRDTNWHDLSTSHFVNVLKGREELLCRPEEGVASMRIIDKIYESAEKA